ncbi:FecR family protein [uncultured Gimesia sp.]|uniref:FecR family protein n=1 Tax=uncultured Gimesia sp. TaxID=1678688 RepID=UPI0030D8C9F8|tara:strand:- start:80170 stop:81585 length:1416 start_codon:yes stop_codon:yes gene_type:complete
MSKTLRNQKALVKLIYEVQNETASTSQLRELADLLRGDPEAQRLYVFLMDMHAELILEEEFVVPDQWDLFHDHTSHELPTKKKAATRKTLSHYLLLTLCYFIPLTVLSYFAYHATKPLPHTQVAVIQEMAEGLLTQDHRPLSENAPLLTGHTYQLQQGVAKLRMNSGAEVILESPATFELLHHNSIRLQKGSLAAEVESVAVGFVVETPSQRVVDLGTRFGVRVDADGTSETHVFQGKVVCAQRQDDRVESLTHFLTTGQAIQIKSDGSAPLPLKTNEDKFTRALKFQAQIERLAGAIEYRQEIPEQIGAGEFTSSQHIYLFQERKNLILPKDVTVWKIPHPGAPENQKEIKQVIPQGTKVNVFLLHLDGPHQDAQGQDHPTVRLSGTIHFKHAVLGGFKKDKDFYTTDQTLGAADVAYDNQKFGQSGRGIDRSDKTTLSEEGHTLDVSWSQRGSGGIGRDQIRIIVATEE